MIHSCSGLSRKRPFLPNIHCAFQPVAKDLGHRGPRHVADVRVDGRDEPLVGASREPADDPLNLHHGPRRLSSAERVWVATQRTGLSTEE